MSDDISIDRLVLDLPGLTAAQGAALARSIGEQLAASTAGAGEYQSLTVTLPLGTDGKAAPGRLATAIVAALLRQIG